MKIQIDNTEDGLKIKGLVVTSDAREIMGYAENCDVNRKVKSGELRFVWVSFGASGQRRLFFRKDCEKIAEKRKQKFSGKLNKIK